MMTLILRQALRVSRSHRLLSPSRLQFARLPTPAARHSSTLSDGEYHKISDHTLESILSAYEDLIETSPEVDVELATGVITLVLPPNGTYVINKQPPNKQIWLSSPLSGPKRYDWDGRWVYARDQSTLGELLKTETRDALGVDLDLDVD